MHRQEPLRRGGRLKSLSLPLASSNWNVRALGPVVLPLGPEVGYAVEPQITKRRAVRRTFVRDSGGWSDTLLTEELAHQLAGCNRVPPPEPTPRAPPLGIDGAPKIHLLAADPDEHLVEVPAPVRDRSSRAQPTCNERPERRHPPTDRLVQHLDASLGEQILDVPVAQREAEIHPDGALDHVGWKAVTGIVRREYDYRYAARGRSPRAANVTSPFRGCATSPQSAAPDRATVSSVPRASGAAPGQARRRSVCAAHERCWRRSSIRR